MLKADKGDYLFVVKSVEDDGGLIDLAKRMLSYL